MGIRLASITLITSITVIGNNIVAAPATLHSHNIRGMSSEVCPQAKYKTHAERLRAAREASVNVFKIDKDGNLVCPKPFALSPKKTKAQREKEARESPIMVTLE